MPTPPARWSLPRVLTTIAVVLVALVASGCSGSPSSDRSGDPATDPDLRYGRAPVPNSDVTYQPDVVIVGGGGTSVRSVTDGGLTWHLNPRAKGADRLAVGKVMFVTGRGVGRVVDVRRNGGDLVATVAPVSFTDVIRDGTFAGKSPVSLEDPLAYEADQPFWAGPAPSTESQAPPPSLRASRSGRNALVLPAFALSGPTLPAPKLGGKSTLKLRGFNVTGECCKSGAGLTFTYDTNGIRLYGKLTLQMAKPSATFDLRIRGATVTKAQLQISGGIGIKVEIEAATNTGRNINELIPIPVDFSVPFANVLGVPLTATVSQLLNVHTVFSSKEGNIKSTGEWAIGGGLGFTYANGSFSANAPTALPVKTSIVDSMRGISVGVNGILLTYQTRITVGIGAFGFVAGLYFALSVTVGLTRGSAAGFPITVCNSAQVTLFASYGIGYRIPKPVADLINFFLSKFGSNPIERQGGIGGEITPFSKSAYNPDTRICRGS